MNASSLNQNPLANTIPAIQTANANSEQMYFMIYPL